MKDTESWTGNNLIEIDGILIRLTLAFIADALIIQNCVVIPATKPDQLTGKNNDRSYQFFPNV
jgi:hypothetical protein